MRLLRKIDIKIYIIYKNKMEILKIKKFHPDAVTPSRANPGDAGLDISSVEDVIIPAKSWKLVDTGLGITVPKGTYGRLAPRSGVSTKGIMINAGVLDLFLFILFVIKQYKKNNYFKF